jgi:hypothetical protein
MVAGGRASLAGEDDGGKAPRAERIAQWIEDLGSDRYAVREAARSRLEREGAAARGPLEARREDPDPEVRRAVGLLLERLEATPVDLPPPALGDLSAVGRVDLDLAEPRPAREALRLLGEPFGARFALPKSAGEVPVRMRVEDAPFFAALDAVAAAAGVSPQEGFSPSGDLFLAPGPMVEPWAAAGPLRVRVTEISVTRSLGGSQRPVYSLTLALDWVPGVQVVSWETPLDIRGEDAAGGGYEAAAASRRRVTHGVGRSSRTGRFQVHLQPLSSPGEEPAPADELASLDFRLPVRLRYDRRETSFPAPFADLPARVAVSDEEEVSLLEVVAPTAGYGPWVARVAARLARPVSLDGLDVWFETVEGHRVLAFGGTRFPSADGRLELTARAHLGTDARAAAVLVVYFREEEQGALAFHLQGVPLR